jgi:acetylglutamate kinase
MVKNPLYIIKIGGNIIDEPASLDQFLLDFSKINFPKILVHGGGKIATQLAEKMGVETIMCDGRRITDKPTLDIVTMVYGGLINKNIVAKLQSLNTNAIGLTGADGGSVISHKRPVKDIDYGLVGDIQKVDSKIINALINIGLVPIFAPLTADKNGQILNTNADTMAQAIAVNLSELYETNLIYCFEKNGVLANPDDDKSLISNLNYTLFQTLKNEGNINKGMIPKLDNAFKAIDEGVRKVTICNAKYLNNLNKNLQFGTTITTE